MRPNSAKRFDCEFESEVLAAAVQGRFPERIDPQLSAHVAGCSLCSETALVAAAIEESRQELSDELRASAVLPDAGRVWWLAQLRARREAVKAAERPITLVHVIALACATGLLGACIGATSEWFQTALRWIQAQPLTGLIASHAVLAVAMAAAIVVIPAAAYWALGRD